MKLLIDIPDITYKRTLEIGALQICKDEDIYRWIAKGTPIPDNITNGEFITMFIPHESITVCKEKQFVIVIGKDYLFQHHYPLDWWNAKYKGASK